MEIKAFAKINLSLNVGRVQPDGMHPVDMFMQAVDLHDTVRVELVDGRETGCKTGSARDTGCERYTGRGIEVKTDRADLPCSEGNLAFRAARAMIERYGSEKDARRALREQLRMHKLAMDGDPSEEEIFAHLADALERA